MITNDKDKLYLVIALVIIFLCDLAAIAGIFIKGHANFSELIKHLT